jgi:transposase
MFAQVSIERGKFIMLEVAMQTTIKTLYKKGYSKAQIARTLKVSRNTVRAVLKSEERGEEELKKRPHPSMLDKHREFIEIQLTKELSIQRIYQDLISKYEFSGSYSTLRDYVGKIVTTKTKAYMVLTALPGEEAQVDFGYIGIIKTDGKAKKAWIFVMSLSYSRYMYACIVFNQSIKVFIQCHVNAFRYFGGVPETVKIDNLKAAIVQADFYEPITQRTYASFAAHYGFWAEPCRVATPTDKGKIESNVKYIKNNCFKGRDFKDIEEAKEFLSTWLSNIANKRIHGTIKRIPEELFNESEKHKLKEVPSDDFIFSKSSRATIQSNCHFSYGGNYYSAPYGYIGCEVDVIEVNNLLKVYFKGIEIALHTLCQDSKGQHVTNTEHYPANKNITSKEILSSQLIKMQAVGVHAVAFFNAFCSKSEVHKYDYRTISGVLALRKKHTDLIIDMACKRALYYNSITYGTVKKICEKGLIALPVEQNESFVNYEETSFSRDLASYSQLSMMGVIENE